MKSLKRLGATIALTFVLAMAAFAGETPTPPCAPPVPGETPTPPCAAQMASDDPATETLPASNAVDLFSVAEGAMNTLQIMLAIF